MTAYTRRNGVPAISVDRHPGLQRSGQRGRAPPATDGQPRAHGPSLRDPHRRRRLHGRDAAAAGRDRRPRPPRPRPAPPPQLRSDGRVLRRVRPRARRDRGRERRRPAERSGRHPAPGGEARGGWLRPRLRMAAEPSGPDLEEGAVLVCQPPHLLNHRPRTRGHSKYGLGRTVRVLLDLFTVKFLGAYGTRPAHLFGGIGLLFAGLGGGVLGYLTYLKLFADEAIGG